MSPRGIVNMLGYAGLVPFLVSAILVAGNTAYSDHASSIAGTYAFGIICFLTGSWWGMNSGRDNRRVIVLSNVYFVFAFLVLMLAPQWWSLSASILLFAVFAVEMNTSLFPELSKNYRGMRAVLTCISAGSMLVIHLAR